LAHTRRTYTDYNPAGLTGMLRELGEAIGSPVQLSVELAPMPQGSVDVRFLPGPNILFIAPESYASDERRDYYSNMWFACVGLFAGVKETYRTLVGQCRFWNDDFPGGHGLAFCGNTAGHFLIPDSIYMESDGYEQLRGYCARHLPAWEDRKPVVFWRGTTTGMRDVLNVKHWSELPRIKLVRQAREVARPDLFDVALSAIVQIWDDEEIAAIHAAGLLGNSVPLLEFMDYKYSIDIDGNSTSWPGLFTKLMMGNLVIKVDSPLGFRQWYYDKLIPWKNFVPITVSMSELSELAEWLTGNDREAAAIAERGRALAQSLSFENVMRDSIRRIYDYVAR
jgi:hypothetical protein